MTKDRLGDNVSSLDRTLYLRLIQTSSPRNRSSGWVEEPVHECPPVEPLVSHSHSKASSMEHTLCLLLGTKAAPIVPWRSWSRGTYSQRAKCISKNLCSDGCMFWS